MLTSVLNIRCKIIGLFILGLVNNLFAHSSDPSDRQIIDDLLEKAMISSNQNFKEAIKISYQLIDKAKEFELPDYKAEGDLLICSMYNSGMNYDSLESHCNSALNYFKNNKRYERLAWAYNHAGVVVDVKGEREKSKEYFEKGIAIFDSLKHQKGLAYCLNDLGVTYGIEGSSNEALEYFYQSLNIFEETNDELGKLRTFTCLGFFYRRQKKYKKAKEYFENAVAIAEKKNEKYWYAMAVNGLVKSLRTEKQFEKAMHFNDQLIAVSQSLHSDYLLFYAYQNESLLFQDVKDFAGTKKAALKVLNLLLKQKRGQGKIKIINTLAKACINLNQFEEAEDYLNEVENAEIATQYELLKSYKLRVQFYEKQNNFKDAFAYQRKYLELKKVLDKNKRQIAVANVEASYELGKKQAKIDLLHEENETKSKILHHRNQLLFVVILLGGILLGVVYRNYFFKKRLNKVLEKKIELRTGDLLLANKKLEKSNEELKRFAYIASHDLKEPLRNISGFLHLIERRKENLTEETATEYLTLAKSNAIQMHELIEDVLNYSQLNDSKEETQKTNLNFIIDQIVSTKKEELDQQKAKVIYNQLPSLNVLTSDMTRLFQNLIENGLKYNTSSAPTIEIESVENQNEFCLFIKDNGIGIEKDYYSKIFEMFSRLHTRNVYKGSGIGLASCKKIVEKYGGEIHVQSKINKGTTFIVTFPRKLEAL